MPLQIPGSSVSLHFHNPFKSQKGIQKARADERSLKSTFILNVEFRRRPPSFHLPNTQQDGPMNANVNPSEPLSSHAAPVSPPPTGGGSSADSRAKDGAKLAPSMQPRIKPLVVPGQPTEILLKAQWCDSLKNMLEDKNTFPEGSVARDDLQQLILKSGHTPSFRKFLREVSDDSSGHADRVKNLATDMLQRYEDPKSVKARLEHEFERIDGKMFLPELERESSFFVDTSIPEPSTKTAHEQIKAGWIQQLEEECDTLRTRLASGIGHPEFKHTRARLNILTEQIWAAKNAKDPQSVQKAVRGGVQIFHAQKASVPPAVPPRRLPVSNAASGGRLLAKSQQPTLASRLSPGVTALEKEKATEIAALTECDKVLAKKLQNSDFKMRLEIAQARANIEILSESVSRMNSENGASLPGFQERRKQIMADLEEKH